MAEAREQQNKAFLEAAKLLAASQEGASFSSFSYETAATLLCEGELGRADFSNYQRHFIAHRAGFEAAKEGKVTPQSLASAIEKLKRDTHKKRQQRFIFRTGVLVNSSFKVRVPSRVLRNTRIAFKGNWSPLLERSEEFRHEVENYIWYDLPPFAMAATIQVTASDVMTASEAAYEALDLRRGIWNISLNRVPIHRSGISKPISRVRRAPLMTPYDKDGKPVEKGLFWYEEYVSQPEVESLTDSDWAKALKQEEWVLDQLSRCHYRNDIEAAIIRYAHALDTWDRHICFMRLWGLLEFLTASAQDSGRATIRRASFLYQNGEHTEIILDTLREYRHRFVHGGYEGPEIDAALFLLDKIVWDALRFVISTASLFSGLDECARFMDMPRDLKKLERVQRLQRMAKRFLTGKSIRHRRTTGEKPV